jgi:L-ascorbate metabolism protein UlaG (beta-lactamase superfamily)
MADAGLPSDRVHALAAGDSVPVGPASVRVVLSKTPEVSDVAHFGYLADFNGLRVYDTGDVMRGITDQGSLLQPLQQAAPHVALITTSPTEEEFPDFREAAHLAVAIGARVAVPAHYGCFARRTFDPRPFIALFPRGQTRAEVIPYCGCLMMSADASSAIIPTHNCEDRP